MGEVMKPARHFRAALLSATVALVSAAGIESAQAWKYKTVYNFTGGKDGDAPYQVTPLLDPATGDIYGTTLYGGNSKCYSEGCGVVFKLAKNGTETVLHTFAGGDDGQWPYGGLIQDEAGHLYGTASGGGTHGKGVVFRIDADGTFTVLHAFEGGSKGNAPNGLIRDATNGDLYGTTNNGGGDDAGIVYKLATDGTLTVLHSFTGGYYNYPSHLLRDASGNIYGTTFYGGDPKCYCGIAYKLTPDTTFSLLHTFIHRATGGPSGALAMDESGNLYGLSESAPLAHHYNGSAFRIAPDGTFKFIHRFNTPPPDPHAPGGPLLMERSGLMYGTAAGGGISYDNGIIFSLQPNGAVQVIYDLGKGNLPSGGGLAEDKKGNLYGVFISYGSGGTIFKLVKD
jgi:uncharacterized repeat protein (TIGR03803 family)